MSEFIVFCDLDGVCVNNLQGACDLLKVDLKNPVIRQRMKDNGGYISDLVGDGVFWKAVERAGQVWWENLSPYCWAHDLVDYISKEATVCFLSSPGRSAYAAAGKVKWIKKNFPKMDRNYILTQGKELCAKPNALLVDDMDKYLKRFKDAGGKAFKWPNSLCLLDGDIDVGEVIMELADTIRKLKTGS